VPGPTVTVGVRVGVAVPVPVGVLVPAAGGVAVGSPGGVTVASSQARGAPAPASSRPSAQAVLTHVPAWVTTAV
jgi:hypothetical protein